MWGGPGCAQYACVMFWGKFLSLFFSWQGGKDCSEEKWVLWAGIDSCAEGTYQIKEGGRKGGREGYSFRGRESDCMADADATTMQWRRRDRWREGGRKGGSAPLLLPLRGKALKKWRWIF